MLETKMLEIRDIATYIPVLAIKMAFVRASTVEAAGVDSYHLRRTGYAEYQPLITLLRLDPVRAEYDPYSWDSGNAVRTMREAHRFIQKHFDALEYGAVVDVEYILGEKPEPKKSERFSQ